MTLDYDAIHAAIAHRTAFCDHRLRKAITVIIPTVFLTGAAMLTVYFLTVSLFWIWSPFILVLTVTVFMLTYSYPPFVYHRWAHRFPEKANRLKELDDAARS